MSIYKNISPDRIDDVLINQTLRISPAAALNDSFEARWRIPPQGMVNGRFTIQVVNTHETPELLIRVNGAVGWQHLNQTPLIQDLKSHCRRP